MRDREPERDDPVFERLRALDREVQGVDLVPRLLARIPTDAWRRGDAGGGLFVRMVRAPLWRAAAVLLVLLGLAAGVLYLGPRPGPADAARPEAIRRGTAWLRERQGDDGAWDARTLGGTPQYATALNALATIACMRDGGAGEAAAARGVRHLVSRQAGDGRLGPDVEGTMYNHGMATVALLEAYRHGRDETLRAPIGAALEFIRRRQSPAGGWGYRPRSPEANLSISVWQIQALLFGAKLGWTEHEPALRRGLAWVRGVMTGDGTFGYERAADAAAPQPTLTSMGAYCTLAAERERVPVDPASIAAVLRGLETVAASPPSDLYGRFFHAAALRSAPEGTGETTLSDLRAAVVASQDRAGYWPAARDRWGGVGGRLYTTAMALMALEPAG